MARFANFKNIVFPTGSGKLSREPESISQPCLPLRQLLLLVSNLCWNVDCRPNPLRGLSWFSRNSVRFRNEVTRKIFGNLGWRYSQLHRKRRTLHRTLSSEAGFQVWDKQFQRNTSRIMPIHARACFAKRMPRDNDIPYLSKHLPESNKNAK